VAAHRLRPRSGYGHLVEHKWQSAPCNC
jgi:hypothetical protein